MGGINELLAVTKELREIEKAIAPSAASGDLTRFVIGVPGVTTSRFSLPSRVYWAGFCSPSTSIYGAPVSSGSLSCFLLTPTAQQIFTLGGRSGAAIDLSDFCVFTGVAASGATLTVFVQTAAPLSSS